MNNLLITSQGILRLPKIINWKKNDRQQEKIKQLHSLAQLGKLSAGIFHDLINPLTAIALNLEQIKREPSIAINQADQYLNQALIAARHMENLLLATQQHLSQQASISSFKLKEKIQEIINILAYQARLSQVNIQIEIPNNLEIKGSATKLGRVFINLISNAIEACADSQTTNKIVKISAQTNQQTTIIQITDNGCGLSSKTKNKIFKAFFSTKQGRQYGSGLGLYISQEIIKQDFSGKLQLINHPKLTIFQIIIPN